MSCLGELLLDRWEGQTIGITGTAGKTTTTALTAEILRSARPGRRREQRSESRQPLADGRPARQPREPDPDAAARADELAPRLHGSKPHECSSHVVLARPSRVARQPRALSRGEGDDRPLPASRRRRRGERGRRGSSALRPSHTCDPLRDLVSPSRGERSLSRLRASPGRRARRRDDRRRSVARRRAPPGEHRRRGGNRDGGRRRPGGDRAGDPRPTRRPRGGRVPPGRSPAFPWSTTAWPRHRPRRLRCCARYPDRGVVLVAGGINHAGGGLVHAAPEELDLLERACDEIARSVRWWWCSERRQRASYRSSSGDASRRRRVSDLATAVDVASRGRRRAEQSSHRDLLAALPGLARGPRTLPHARRSARTLTGRACGGAAPTPDGMCKSAQREGDVAPRRLRAGVGRQVDRRRRRLVPDRSRDDPVRDRDPRAGAVGPGEPSPHAAARARRRRRAGRRPCTGDDGDGNPIVFLDDVEFEVGRPAGIKPGTPLELPARGQLRARCRWSRAGATSGGSRSTARATRTGVSPSASGRRKSRPRRPGPPVAAHGLGAPCRGGSSRRGTCRGSARSGRRGPFRGTSQALLDELADHPDERGMRGRARGADEPQAERRPRRRVPRRRGRTAPRDGRRRSRSAR